MTVGSFTQTINALPEDTASGSFEQKSYSTGIQCSDADSIEPRICKRGHEVNGANIYLNRHGNAECRACRRLASSRFRGKNHVFDPNYIPPAKRTHCPKGHPYSIENTRFHATRGHRICRICRNEEHRRLHKKWVEQRRSAGLPAYKRLPYGGAAGHLSADQVRIIAERLRAGETMAQITSVDPVCADPTFRAFRHRYAHLWKPLAKLAEANRRRRWIEGLRSRRSFASPAVMQNDGADAFNAICAATRELPDFLRDDVRSAMFLAAAEGRLKPRDAAKRLREFVTAHNRQFSKFVPGGGGIMRSLDEQVYDDGPTRLVDTVTHGLWQ